MSLWAILGWWCLGALVAWGVVYVLFSRVEDVMPEAKWPGPREPRDLP